MKQKTPVWAEAFSPLRRTKLAIMRGTYGPRFEEASEAKYRLGDRGELLEKLGDVMEDVPASA